MAQAAAPHYPPGALAATGLPTLAAHGDFSRGLNFLSKCVYDVYPLNPSNPFNPLNLGKNLLKSFFVSGGFAEVNPEKCIVLAESVDEVNALDKSSIEKEIQELSGQENDMAKNQLGIAKAKIEAIDSNFYEKV